MDTTVQQSSVDKQCLEISKKELLLENDRLLQQIMSQDILLTVMKSMFLNDESVNMERKRNKSCDREAYIDYLNYTQEQADILQGIVKQAKVKQPLDNALNFACKHAQQIQELLVYVRDTRPNAIKLNKKKVVVTPKNKVKKVRKPKSVTNVGSSRKAKIVESKNANHSKSNHTEGSNATDIPLSSSLVMTGCPDCSVVSELRMFKTHDREPLSAHKLCCPDCSVVSELRMFKTHDREPLSAHKLFQDVATPRVVVLADSPVSTSIDQDAPSTNYTSQVSSSNMRQTHTPFEHLSRWTKDHPIENVIGDPSCFVSTRKQLQTDAMWCYFDAFLTSVKPKNFKHAMTKPSWIDEM
nr:hypothetical protein [Tanacetum cinerariifolium]